MTSVRAIALIALLALPGHTTAGWFDADTRELLAAAQPLESDGDADVVILAEEGDVELAADGRRTVEYRTAYRIVTRAGLDEWASVQCGWAPWYEERPVVRARVVSPDGSIYELEPAKLVDRAARDVSDAVFDDHRIIGAPLPSVAAGSIVEISIITREIRPYFDGGVAARFTFGRFVPVRRTRFRVSAPSSLPLKLELVGLPGLEAKRREADGRVEVTVEAGSLPARPFPEASGPQDTVWLPYVGYATGASWKDVSAAYSSIVDSKLRGADLDAAVKTALRGATQREAKIEALTQWLHEKVRYTGVQFGAGILVPASPTETLTRGYGDCKDKSLLLVAMLRRAGLAAHLALVLTGPDPEIEPGLPGLGVFDHAIVRVAGEPPVWIDATDETARPGVLAPSVEGRRVLVVSPATDALASIPESRSKDNLDELSREIFIAERGPSRVIETNRGSGWVDRSLRSTHASLDPIEVRKTLEKSGLEGYKARTVDRVAIAKPLELSKPFTVSIELSGANLGASFVDGVRMAIAIPRMWDGLVQLLPEPSETKRVMPVWISQPSLVAWEFLFHLPPGIAVASLPEDSERSLGPARLTTRSVRESPERVRVRLEADSGKRLWSEDEVAAFRAAVEALESPTVVFERTGYAHRQAGRYEEALAEHRRLAVLHPTEALHVSEIAEDLLAAGLGETAREQARRATALDPRSAYAHQALGWVLLHDEVGRLFREGCDLAGAERAFRAMKAIDASDPRARANLALSLEYAPNLVHRGQGARLDAAIEEWKSIRTELEDKSFDADLLTDLALLGRYGELGEIVPTAESASNRHAMDLVAVWGTQGLPSALARAQRLNVTDVSRREALVQLGWFLLNQRRYADASKALSSAASGASNAVPLRALADWAGSLKQAEPLPDASDDPTVVIRTVLRLMLGSGSAESLASLGYDGGNVQNITRAMTSFQRELGATGLRPEVITDVVDSTTAWSLDGDASIGWRVEGSLKAPATTQRVSFYLLPKDGRPRVLTAGVPFDAAGHILDLVDSGELAGAQRWLDWAVKEFSGRRGSDPLTGPGFLNTWKSGDPAEPRRLRLAAAALGVGTDAAPRAIPHLEEAKSTVPEKDRGAIYGLLLTAYDETKQWEERARVAREALEIWPESGIAFEALSEALNDLERLDEIAKVANERLSTRPDDIAALRALSRATVRRGPREGWDGPYRRFIESKKAWLSDYNNYAWAAFAFGRVTDEDLDNAKHASSGKDPDSAALNTLAALYAELGRNSEAKEALLAGMQAERAARPAPADWFVVGQIAENLGEVVEARRFYARAIAPGDDRPTSLSVLAGRRIAALDARSKRAAPQGRSR